MEIEQIRKVLERYTQGKCTEEEVRIIEQWFASVNRHRSAMIQEEFLQEQLEEVRMRLADHIAASDAPVVPLRPRRRRVWAIAAGAAAMLTGAIAFSFLFTSTPADHPSNPLQSAVQSAPAKSNRVVRNGFVEITTAKGATEKIVLADGSTVNLNAGSRLRYPVSFSGPNRDIYLEEGEAFFKVAEDPRHPFIVHSRGLATTALGTSFNIRAYSREQRITVALLTGKVKVGHAHQQEAVILLPSEQLSFDLQSLAVAKSTFREEDDIVGWKHGVLAFRDASYSEVATELENRYNVTMVNETGNADWTYTGSFRDESLQEIIETICQIKNISYTLKNDTIFLTRKN
ncbi:FecR domain-containing protein [Chitinophaga pollutisoli]|uniref:FecR domain-containing protein n=1 Tax=Chitinophaga pollutisoli TaxID=3133966 RepID=A0ABZ2YMN0_9BACT